MKYQLATLLFALPLLVGQASAQDQQDERPRRDGEMRARMIEEFDADGDGKLSDEERQKARETMRARRGDRPGRGGEGRPAPPDPNQLFDKFDENKDGQLSREEFLKLSEETRGFRGPRGPREGRPGGPRPDTGATERPRRGPEGAQGPPAGDRQDEAAGPRGPRRNSEGRGAEGRGPEGRGGGGRGQGLGGPNRERIFNRFDEDSDNKLNLDEFKKLSDWTREIRERVVNGGERGRGPRGEGGPGRGGQGRSGQGRGGSRSDRPQRPAADAAPEAEAPPVDNSST